jgi:hypothetical protein
MPGGGAMADGLSAEQQVFFSALLAVQGANREAVLAAERACENPPGAREWQLCELLPKRASDWGDWRYWPVFDAGVLCRQWVRCGRPGCRCARGELHGPYWYLFRRDDAGRLHKRYVPLREVNGHLRLAAMARVFDALLAAGSGRRCKDAALGLRLVAVGRVMLEREYEVR